MDAPGRDTIEALLGRPVRGVEPYVQALSHRSLRRGTDGGHDGDHTCSNERLEFLGDALLGAEVAEALFHRFPDRNEGYLTRLRARLVSGKALARCARRLELGRHLLMSENAARAGARDNASLLANAFEALLGALYLDLGAGAMRSFVQRHVLAPVDLEALAGHSENYKSRLLERMQAEARTQPTYRIAETNGPPHDRTFTAEVLLDGEPRGTGTAASKQKAEQKAAAEALESLG